MKIPSEAQSKSVTFKHQSEVVAFRHNNNNQDLWLEKYKPKKYDDLLTEEKTNRDILTWLKSWDEIVFKKKDKVKLIEKYEIKPKDKEKNYEIFSKNKPQSLSKFKLIENELTYLKNKVILLAGPPGIGKTTLAKVLALHCGYDPLIINASDERTPEKLFQKIYDSTQIHNLNFSKLKKGNPTCLILDEIDGALDGVEGKNSINGILEFIKSGKIPNKFKSAKGKRQDNDRIIKDKPQEEEDHEYENEDDIENEKKGLKNKEKQKNMNNIKRPIICICNDLYAKVLKQMRKEALVFNFKKGNFTKLLSRLKEICASENMIIDNPTLRNLCIKSGQDIRLCVNTLQFISYNKKNVFFLNSLSKEQLTVLGSKDIGENIFETWSKLFTASKDVKFKQIRELYFSHGNFDMINDGIFMNYTKIFSKDSEVESRARLMDYLSYEDNINKEIQSEQLYELLRFQCLPGAFIKANIPQNNTDKINIEFPSSLIDFKRKKKTNLKILNLLKENFEDDKKNLNLISLKSFVTDYLPYLYQLIQPNIREINTELLNYQETFQLKQAVSLLNSLGIKLQDSEENNFFEPDIKSLLDFKIENCNSHRLTERMKIILNSELETFKHFKDAERMFPEITIASKEEDKNKSVENKLKMNMIGAKRKANQVYNPDYKFVYKYNEGVTNKVNRSLNVNYFFNNGV